MSVPFCSGWFSLVIEANEQKHNEISEFLMLPISNELFKHKKIWCYKECFDEIQQLDYCINSLLDKINVENISSLKNIYRNVYFSLYVQSEYAQLNFFISPSTQRRLSKFDLELNTSILSWGGVEDE
jgi:hypothetical protein